LEKYKATTMEGIGKIRKAVSRFSELSDGEWERFAGLLETRPAKKGECLTRGGQVEDHIYFLCSGSARTYFLQDGREITVDFHFEGEFVTAYFSLITREPSGTWIELLEDSEVIVIGYNALQALYKVSAAGERVGRLMAEHQYVRRFRKEMEMLSFSAEERYRRLLERSPQIVQQVSVKHLSSYLGIQPESLSRIRKAVGRN
jgi:CRP-like cAMP-binding protein